MSLIRVGALPLRGAALYPFLLSHAAKDSAARSCYPGGAQSWRIHPRTQVLRRRAVIFLDNELRRAITLLFSNARPSTWLASILREDFTAEEQHRRIRLLKQNADDEHGVPTVLPPRKRGEHASRRRRHSVRGQEDARIGDEQRAREEAGQSATEGRARLEGQRRIAQKMQRARITACVGWRNFNGFGWRKSV
ncbi:hypothetical protein K438DRAFT_1981222 [Mycena galopus ATCC 62051]|nr:hypothetical protein K438DRAFT_1981222 [Mycena galopus ATCC 62051]